MAIARWSKANPNWGSHYRIQRNVYAMRVALIMTKGLSLCPSCLTPWDITSDSLQVDRVIPSLDYCEGNITYVCEACNQGRAQLQRVGSDWQRVKDYARDVARASARVSVPSIPEARREWQAWREGRGGNASRYA